MTKGLYRYLNCTDFRSFLSFIKKKNLYIPTITSLLTGTQLIGNIKIMSMNNWLTKSAIFSPWFTIFFLQSFNKIHNFFPTTGCRNLRFCFTRLFDKIHEFFRNLLVNSPKNCKNIHGEESHVWERIKVQHSIFHYAGFSYFKCDSPNPTHYFKSCNFI